MTFRKKFKGSDELCADFLGIWEYILIGGYIWYVTAQLGEVIGLRTRKK